MADDFAEKAAEIMGISVEEYEELMAQTEDEEPEPTPAPAPQTHRTAPSAAPQPGRVPVVDTDDQLFSEQPILQYPDGTLAPQELGEVLDYETKQILVPESADVSGPTWGKPLARIQIPAGISADVFRDVLANAYRQYLVHAMVTVEEVSRTSRYSESLVRKVLTTPEMKYAAEVRGFQIEGVGGITAEMDYALAIILDPHDGLTMTKKLKKAGISTTKYQAWLKNPLFRSHVEAVGEDLHSTNHVAFTQLAQKVGDGDLAAIKYWFEINGRYNPARQQTVDVMVVMSQIMEIISKNVHDRDILTNIAGEMKQLAQSSTMQPPTLT